jgi:hypothetical protein
MLNFYNMPNVDNQTVGTDDTDFAKVQPKS